MDLNSKIFHLQNDVKNIEAMIQTLFDTYNNDGAEITPTMEAENKLLIASLGLNIDHIFIAQVILSARENYYKEIAAGLADGILRKAVSAKRLDNELNETLRQLLNSKESKKMEGNYYGFRLQKISDKVEIFDADKVPIWLRRSEPNVSAIREELKKGNVIEGAKLEPAFAVRSFVKDEVKK